MTVVAVAVTTYLPVAAPSRDNGNWCFLNLVISKTSFEVFQKNGSALSFVRSFFFCFLVSPLTLSFFLFFFTASGVLFFPAYLSLLPSSYHSF